MKDSPFNWLLSLTLLMILQCLSGCIQVGMDSDYSSFRNQDCSLKLKISICETKQADTKGIPFSSVDDFRAFGYLSDEIHGDTELFENELFRRVGNCFASENECSSALFPGKKRVLAIAPASSVGESFKPAVTNESVSFICTVPSTSNGQGDILAGDTGYVNDLSEGIVVFSHIMSQIRFESSDVVPQCTVRSISLAGLHMSGIFSFENGWIVNNGISSSVCECNANLMQNQSGVQLHSDEGRMMLIPQTLPQDCRLVMVVEIDGKQHELECSTGGLVLAAGTVTTFSLSFDAVESPVLSITGTSVFDIGPWIDDGYTVMDLFIVNGGDSGSPGYEEASGSMYYGFHGSKGKGGNSRSVFGITLKESQRSISVKIGDGGVGGINSAGAGGVSSVSYDSFSFSPPGNDGTCNGALNPLDERDPIVYGVDGAQKNYGDGGKGGGYSSMTMSGKKRYSGLPGGSGISGVVFVRFRKEKIDETVISLACSTMSCKKNLLNWNATATFEGVELSQSSQTFTILKGAPYLLTIPITTSGVGIWSALYRINVILTGPSGSRTIATATYSEKTVSFSDFDSLEAGDYSLSIELAS